MDIEAARRRVINQNRKMGVAAGLTGLSMVAVMWSVVSGFDSKPEPRQPNFALTEPLTLNLSPYNTMQAAKQSVDTANTTATAALVLQ